MDRYVGNVAAIFGALGPGFAVLKYLDRAMRAAGMYRPGYRWLNPYMLLAIAVLAGSLRSAEGQLLYQLHGYYPNPVSMFVQLDVTCDSTYVWKSEDNYPTCHSQLNYIKGKSDYYRYNTRYNGIDSDYMIPNPLNWDKWQKVGSGPHDRISSNLFCDQSLENTEISDKFSVCKQARVCKVREAYISQRLAKEYDPNNAQTPLDSGQVFEINQDWEDTRDTHYAHTVDRCTLCAPVECADSSCANGALPMVPVPAYNKKVFNRPNCVEKKCSAGTFLTCNTGLDCVYQVPSVYHTSGATGAKAWLYQNQYAVKSDLNLGGFWPLPVDSCYPCKYANGRTHYGQYFGTDNSLLQDDFLQFMCPGEAKAPVACGRNMVSKFDSAGISGKCECMNGYYKKNEGDTGCTTCPPGFQCAWKGMTPPTKVECEIDTYSYEGSSKCRQCNVNTNICPKSQALTRCVRGNDGEYQSKDAYCTDCSTCRQITNAVGALPCNRVISVVNADGTGIK